MGENSEEDIPSSTVRRGALFTFGMKFSHSHTAAIISSFLQVLRKEEGGYLKSW